MKYKVGDKVRVRQWDDMEKEFGLSIDGNINMTGWVFTKFMKDFCGKVLVVDGVKEDDFAYLLHNGEFYYFTDEMLEPVEESTEFVYDHSEEKEMVHHPSHYNLHKHECIEEMIALFGIEAVIGFCKCNIHKYRYRAAGKDGERDLHKADEYMDILLDLEKRYEE